MLKSFPLCSLMLSLIAVSLCAEDQNVPDFSLSQEFSASNQDMTICQSFDDTLIVHKGRMNANSKVETRPCKEMTPASACPNYWRFSGDYLYLLPTVDDTFFVIDSPIATGNGSSILEYPNGRRKNNDFGFNSAFRLGAEFAMCNGQRELEVYYTYFTANQNRSVSGDFLWATAGPSGLALFNFENYTGSASSRLSLFYERVDVDFSQQLIDAHGVHFYLKAGIEYASVRFRGKISYAQSLLPSNPTPTTGFYREKSKFSGIGPQFGLALDYNFYETKSCSSCRHLLGMTGLFSGSLLVSRERVKANSSVTAYNIEDLEYFTQPIEDITDSTTWRTLPALHARVGLNYTLRSRYAGFSVEVGYEIDSYIRGLTRVIFPDSSQAGQSFNEHNNFDIQGLYATAGLSF